MEINSLYDRECDFTISIWGEGRLNNNEDRDRIMALVEEYETRNGSYPDSISIVIEDSISSGYDYGVTSVDAGVFEDLKNVKEIIIPPSVETINTDPQLFKNNKTVIRGEYETYAEKYADDNDLKFVHSDMLIGYIKKNGEVTSLYLVVRNDGGVELYRKEVSPGLENGSYFAYDDADYSLKKDFYKDFSAKDIASWYNEELEEDILDRGVLEDYINKLIRKKQSIS